MAPRRKDPFDEMRKFQQKLQENMNRMFDRAWSYSDFAEPIFKQTGIRTALSDIHETAKEVTVRLELPGVEKKDIALHVEGNQLEVSVERREAAEQKKKDTYRTERSYRGFYRSLTLPPSADTSKINADYRAGILTVKMPKKKAKKTNRIKVK